MHVKICGITNEADARLVSEAGADFLGLIRVESPRRISMDRAEAVMAAAGDGARPVLVYRDTDLPIVLEEVARLQAAWVQLHGRESVAYVEKLREAAPRIRIIRAWETGGRFAAVEIADYFEAAVRRGLRFDVLLLDVPKGAAKHPGFAALGDVARQCQALASEVWCAGALTPDNVGEALVAGMYDGVDVARGVEQAPGRKDAELVRRFVAAARRH